MRCQACDRNCSCPRTLHTGEGKVLVGLTRPQLEELIDASEAIGASISYSTVQQLRTAKDLVS